MKIALAAFVLVLAFGGSPAPRRTLCCHGCNSKYCKTSNCGKTCSAPCKGCWKKECPK